MNEIASLSLLLSGKFHIVHYHEKKVQKWYQLTLTSDLY